jgi:hypothetical protein
MVREAEREIEKESIPVLENLEKKLLELWQRASAIAGGGEPLPARVEAAPETGPLAAAKPEKEKKEDTKPLKITF